MAERAKKYTGEIDLTPTAEAVVRKDSGVDLTTYKERLSQSFNKKQSGHSAPGFVFTVPNEAVASLKSRFRQAARELNLGVAFSERVSTVNSENTDVTVEARTKKVMPPRAGNGATKPVAAAGGLPKPSGKAGK